MTSSILSRNTRFFSILAIYRVKYYTVALTTLIFSYWSQYMVWFYEQKTREFFWNKCFV